MKHKNTYSLLIQAEEKGRSIFEGTIYGLVILCVAFTGWQFASNSVVLPGQNRADAVDSGIAVEVLESVAPAPVIASR